MNNIIKTTIKSLKDSGVLIHRVKDETKREEGGFLGALFVPLAASIVQPVISSVVKGISGRGLKRAGRDYAIKIS